MSAIATSPPAWWLVRPEAWAAEQAALAAAGATWSEEVISGLADPDDGPSAPPRMVLHVDWPHSARQPGDPATLRLEATFSPAAPWFAPTVVLPQPLTGLDRHRNPATGQLCLLAHPSDWQAGRTLADLLTSQLPVLLAAGRDPGAEPATLALEAGAEPAWGVTHLALGGLLVDTNCIPAADVPGGWVELVPISTGIAPVSALITVEDATSRVLWAGDAFSGNGARRIPWVRLPDLPGGGLEGSTLWTLAVEQLAELPMSCSAENAPKLIAVLVAGEGPDRQPRDEWLLLSRGTPQSRRVDTLSDTTDWAAGEAPRAEPGGGQLALFHGVQQTPPVRVRVRVRRSYAIDRAALTARLPGDTTRLADATVTVVGVGALGAPVAMELARAGVGGIRLIDGDQHDPATGSRQPLTLRDTGMPKALAIALNLIDVNPHLKLTTGLRYLGADDDTELSGLIASSLVIDCTANSAVSRYLAAHLRETGTPLLIASATAGAWGGAITALPSAGGGCWECVQLHRAARTIPWPSARPDGQLVPVGCSHPTYVGAWHDSLGHVALQTARTAMALLTAPVAGPAAEPSANPYGDLQVVSLYRRGRPVHPRWQTRQLTIHPDCPLHQSRSQQRRIALTGRAQ